MSLQESIDRVAAYLDVLPELGGPFNHETVHAIGVGGVMYELTTDDLHELLAAARSTAEREDDASEGLRVTSGVRVGTSQPTQ